MANAKASEPIYVDLNAVIDAIGVSNYYISCCRNIREYEVAEETFHAIRNRILGVQKQTREDVMGESEWLPTHPTLNSVQCKVCGAVHDVELPHCPHCGRPMIEKEN